MKPMKCIKAGALALTLTAAILGDAGASGDYGPSYTMFRAWTAPDIALERFQAGDLGVIQPGMRRVYLYTAWRALSLGPAVAAAPGLQGGLARADGSAFANGWSAAPDTDTDPAPVLTTRLAQVLHLELKSPQVSMIVACAPAATIYAAQVLRAASSRADATPARLDAWVLNQQKVGAACQLADDWRYRDGGEKRPVLAGPAPLAAGEPLYWRQLNDYQRAAWTFQSAHYADSIPLFEKIGATPGHPMQSLGAYLALRSAVREALALNLKPAGPARREQQALALEQRGAAILADPTLATMHEPTRALLRSMRAALTPESRVEELSRALDDPAADPFQLDRLGDWSVLMNDAGEAAIKALRASHEFIDWTETVRGCTGIGVNPACEPAGAHALARWQQSRSRPWLVAALMLTQSAAPAQLVQAGMALAPDDPAWVTVRYHLARLTRLQGKPQDTLAIADGVLQRRLSPGTRNLLRQERFAVATSVPEAARYLLRTNVDYARNAAGSDNAIEASSETMLDDDGLNWLNGGLAVADLVEVARQQDLPLALRTRIAGAAWIRAALLDQRDQGRQAGALLAQLAPHTAPAVARYNRAASNTERRHAVLVEALRFGLDAQLTMDPQAVDAAQASPPDATASGWCSFKDAEQARAGAFRKEVDAISFTWRFPPRPETGHAGARRADMNRLGAMKTATGVTGDDVMAWAASHPRDPELPWLLHVVVMSTRGGCLDADADSLSRRAWRLLQQRYGDSDWAYRTPYFYARH